MKKCFGIFLFLVVLTPSLALGQAGGIVTRSLIVGVEVDVLMAYGSGVNYNDITINSALTAIGSTNKVAIVLRPGMWTIANNLTIPSNITLRTPPGCVIVKSGTSTLTINGPFEAGLYQVFSGFSTGNVVFGAGSVREIYPQWWGADNTGGNAAITRLAIQCAVDSLPGAGDESNITTATPGPVVRLVAGKYASDGTRITVTKNNTHILGDGSLNTWFTYSGASTFNELIRFKNSNMSELSGIMLNGGARATAGSDAGVTFDLASFFTSRDLYIMQTRFYGIRAINLWESYFENTHIRATGQYSTVLQPGAAIIWTNLTQEQMLYPTPVGNNTIFVKPTLVPYGGLVRMDTRCDNITFISPITETTPYLPNGQYLAESQWFIGSSSTNIVIQGGYWSGNEQNQAPATGSHLFNIQNQAGTGIVIRDYLVRNPHDSYPSKYPQLQYVWSIANDPPVVFDNLTIDDPHSSLGACLYIGGQTYISTVKGRVTYRNNGRTKRTITDLFYDGPSLSFFDGDFTIQNGDTDITKMIHYKRSPWENRGLSSAIASGGTIAHGLKKTPTFVSVLPVDAGLSNVYVAVDGTNITVNYTGGGTHAFYWSASAY